MSDGIRLLILALVAFLVLAFMGVIGFTCFLLGWVVCYAAGWRITAK